MKKTLGEQVLGNSNSMITSAAMKISPIQQLLLTAAEPVHQTHQHIVPSPANKSFVLRRMNKLGKKADKFANGFREHVRLGPKITEIVKGKLSLGARILKVGGMSKIFKKLFSVGEGERLLKTCQCYLSTTDGPIAGLLFISTQNIAFCSERSIKFSSPNGQFLRMHYKVRTYIFYSKYISNFSYERRFLSFSKLDPDTTVNFVQVLIPLEKITSVNQSENVKNPSQKYIEMVTVDNFDFWFMGFLNYHKAINHLQQTISQLQINN
ncbi:hypothetical protein Dsin_016185 [Dipteronia sinensis]|uniref:GRAM domain-containing protein n=1 Tax=Dipteronia sinensis TaxID=43782 RepID=A0AAE0ACQ6_9ROSI|nr:hypothetical protein Dsin_016185 [Dipteronia sinensis]